MSSPHSPPSSSTRPRRTARPHHKSKPGTPSGETRGRAQRFRLWLPDGPIIKDYGNDDGGCWNISCSITDMKHHIIMEMRGMTCLAGPGEDCNDRPGCPYLPLEV